MSDSDICSDYEKSGGIGSAMANILHRHIRDQAFPAPQTQVAALPVVCAAEENKQIIMICVKDHQTGEETMFKMYNSTKMSKVFRVYEKYLVLMQTYTPPSPLWSPNNLPISFPFINQPPTLFPLPHLFPLVSSITDALSPFPLFTYCQR